MYVNTEYDTLPYVQSNTTPALTYVQQKLEIYKIL